MKKAVQFSIDISLFSFALLLVCVPLSGGWYLRSSDHYITTSLGVNTGALAIWAASAIEWNDADPEKMVMYGGIPSISSRQSLFILDGAKKYSSIVDPSDRVESEKREEKINSIAQRIVAMPKRESGLIGGTFLYVAQPFIHNGQQCALVVLSSRQEILEYKTAIRNLVLITSFISLCIALVLAFVFHGLLTKPLKILAKQAADAISLGKGESIVFFGQNRKDEIGLLSRSFASSISAVLEKNEAIDAFSSDVLHELKNPLAGIRAAIELLQNEEGMKGNTLLTTVMKETARAESLLYSIRELGSVDRAASGQCFPQLLFEQLEQYYSLLGRVVFKTESISSTESVYASEDRLGQALRNLIDNALDFSPGDTVVEVFVRIETIAENRRLVIEVNDRGPGIKKEEATKIFTRFYSTRKNDFSGKHSGLGLSIANSIIHAANGTLAYQDRKGGGGSFIVHLPVGIPYN